MIARDFPAAGRLDFATLQRAAITLLSWDFSDIVFTGNHFLEPLRTTEAVNSRFAERTLWNVRGRRPLTPAWRPRTSQPWPTSRFFRDELSEIGGRSGKRRAAQVGKSRPHLGWQAQR